jgi:hypothetical protein
MTLHVKTASAWTAVNELHVKTGGAWAEVQNAYVRDAGTWKEFYTAEEPPPEPPPTLTVSAPSSTVSHVDAGFASSGSVQSLSSDVPTITVTGATGTKTYLWTRVSGPSVQGAFSVASSTSLTPRWAGYAVDGPPSTETWRCTVTDSIGVTGYKDFTISLGWSNLT